VTKIDRWWIREVEIPTNPDFDGREVADDDIQSGNMLFLQMMVRIVEGNDSAAFYEEFFKEVGDRLKTDELSASQDRG
jgi:hypothetical protein